MQSIYQDLIAAGVDCSNWNSDLYFPVNEKTLAILAAHKEIKASRFTSENTGESMFEAPFAFDPYWQKLNKQ